ncbi:hypothetical protein AB0L65_35745 [Nonomuraea sp. NPDC052116]|uniref:hypothetical protein n=1 Tax=Nonomuraea sp. NPDC052116 TaxID=3155665 RepID=UPI00344A04A7
MNRIPTSALAAGLTMAVVLTGCGSPEPTAQESAAPAGAGTGPVTVTWWSWDESKFLDPVVAKFNAAHDHIKLKEAVEAGVWITTAKEAIDASYQQDTKQYAWPGAVPDPSPWIDSVVPEKLFGERKGEARGVILKATQSGRDPWVVGPNFTGVFSELQDQWAKIVTKEITVCRALEHMQKFTVDDLKSKNINVLG